MKRKILAIFLAAIMMCSALPVLASAHSSALLKTELLDNDAYYHIDYVKENNYFKKDINLYTAFGLYDGAWYNYFDKNVDIDYATSILLALIEKVEVEYQNEDFEKFVKVLEGASTAADVINKVNEYTGILDFAESNEWSTSITVLNELIKVANYGNAMYEAFIKGYASILSARAASIYYSEFLQRIIDNCNNEAVVAAATKILADINNELEDSVKALVAELAKSATKDAVDTGVSIALSTNTVTGAIKSVYNFSNNLAEKLFKTSSKYGYMCSITEIYYIEDCVKPWVEEKVARNDTDALAMRSFAINAMLTLRESGEALLAGLATTESSSIQALSKTFDIEEIKVRTAVATAKLGVFRTLFNDNVDDNFAAVYTTTGDCDVLIRHAGEVAGFIDGDTDVPVKSTTAGYIANVYNDALGSYVKVAVLAPTDKTVDVVAYNAATLTPAYLQIDTVASDAVESEYATVSMLKGRVFYTTDALADYSGEAVHALSAKNSSDAYANAAYSADFSTTPVSLVFNVIGDADASATEDVELGFIEKLNSFFDAIKAFFVKIFRIVK